jgi:hypothetical protein
MNMTRIYLETMPSARHAAPLDSASRFDPQEKRAES